MDRSDRRISKNLIVSFGDQGFEDIGMIENISKNGMYISSNRVYGEERELTFSIALPDNIFNVRGVVRWLNDAKKGMGIRIREAPVGFINYVEMLKYKVPKHLIT